MYHVITITLHIHREKVFSSNICLIGPMLSIYIGVVKPLGMEWWYTKEVWQYISMVFGGGDYDTTLNIMLTSPSSWIDRGI